MFKPRELYEEMWQVPAYGEHSPGEQHVSIFLDMTSTAMRTTVLDAGCGSGKGALALQQAGFSVTMCDITDSGLALEAMKFKFTQCCLWDAHLVRKVGFHDWVYCCDVMEHIPIALTMLVVAQLLSVARRGVFFSINFQPDVMGYFIGKALHETVMPFVWWRDQLGMVGKVVEARDMINSGAFLVVAR